MGRCEAAGSLGVRFDEMKPVVDCSSPYLRYRSGFEVQDAL